MTALIKSPATVATTENARKSGDADRLFVTQEVAKISGAVDIVVMNIFAERAESAIHAYRERIAYELPTTDRTWVRLVGRRI